MRHMLLALLVASAALAGCAADSDAPTQEAPEEEPPEEESPAFSLEGHPEFCDSEAACDFWDEKYHEYVVYDLDTTVLDVLIVPPASPGLDHVDASRAAVEAWHAGIEELGATWFTDNFSMNVFVLGQDVPTPDALADPEIIVVSAGATETLVGIGLEPKQILCPLAGEGARRVYDAHRHDGMEVFAADCTGTGFTCVALNVAGAPDGKNDLYDLIAHEVGHCLGAGHVGDALDFRARYAPVQDIMSYQSDPAQVHCVSNLNVRVLEGVYAHLLERPEDTFLPAGSFLEGEPAEYAHVACADP